MKYNNHVSYLDGVSMRLAATETRSDMSKIAKVVNRIREIHKNIQNNEATTADHLELQILSDVYFEMRKLKVAWGEVIWQWIQC